MMKSVIGVSLAALSVAILGSAVRADVFFMRDGTRIEGELVQHKGAEIVVKIGSSTIGLMADQVEKIELGPSPLQQYRQRLAAAPDTPAAHVELARWCAAKRLSDEARDEYFKAIHLDPDNAAARAAVGYVKRGSEWLTLSEAREFDARTRQRQEQQAILSGVHDQKFQYRRNQWKSQFEQLDKKALSGWFLSDEAQAAQQEIMAIRDPAAVQPLLEVFGGQSAAEKRLMAVQAVAAIGGEDAALGLLNALVRDPDVKVVATARRALVATDSPKVLLAMNNILRSDDGQARDRVAPVLADLGIGDSVLGLINSLVTSESYVIHHAIDQTQRSWIVIGTQQNYVANLTPVVAEAAVGFQPTIGTVLTGSLLDVKAMVEPWDEHVSRIVTHPAVLNALQRLTGQDFGYDIRAWHAWYFSQQAAARKGAPPAPPTAIPSMTPPPPPAPDR
jgi:hypothetical protein